MNRIQEQKDFYNAESTQYSGKRYEGRLETYIQYVFRKRLELFMDLLPRTFKENGISIFEIGCADGVVLNTIEKKCPEKVSRMVGIDVSEGMISEARRRNPNPQKISYFVRGEEPVEKYDVVLELGVHTDNLDEEIEYVTNKMEPGQYFIYSLASRKSLHALLKVKEPERLLTYSQAETKLKEHFTVITAIPYGFFTPKLWTSSVIGAALQPVIDYLFRFVAPKFFHEKIYLLKLKER